MWKQNVASRIHFLLPTISFITVYINGTITINVHGNEGEDTVYV